MTGRSDGRTLAGQKIVAMTWIGDGGSSFPPACFTKWANFAAAQKAPFVLILKIIVGLSTPVRKQLPLENLADRAKGLWGGRLQSTSSSNGNDVVACTRLPNTVSVPGLGEGPILIEAKTHSCACVTRSTIPPKYVPKEVCALIVKRATRSRETKVFVERKLLEPGQEKLEEKTTRCSRETGSLRRIRRCRRP